MARYLSDFMPAMAMIAVQCIFSAMAIFAKAVFEQGMSPAVFVVYRQAIATLVLAPVTIIYRRGCMPMGWRGYCLVFIGSLIGVTLSQYFYYQGLHLATSSVATAMLNLVPGITFVLAASVGLEKVTTKSVRTMAKVLGTVICVGGAVFMGLFKGPKLLNVELPTPTPISSIDRQWVMGFLFLIGCTCCWSLWLILQVQLCKEYLDPLSLSAWTCFMSTCQSAVLAFFLVPDSKDWKITSILDLISCLFVGIFGSGVTFFLQSWTISVRGPLFSSVFNPLCTVITTISSILILHEEVHIGSLVGAVGVICGLYMVLWGKAKDLDSAEANVVERGSYRNDMEPLLSESLPVDDEPSDLS